MENKISKLKKVPLRMLWKKEDRNFTRWLEKNIDFLNDVLDFDISIERREKSVGPFNVDLYGEDNFGNKVIVENQLEKTDHEHLGKVITYLTNLDANIAVWISKNPSQQHIKAVDWLNEVSPDNIAFYLVKVEAIQIEGQSAYAPLFTVIKEPSKEARQIGLEKKEYAERHVLRKEFWTNLLEKANSKTKLFSAISPNIYHWVGTGAGKSGISYNFILTNKKS